MQEEINESYYNKVVDKDDDSDLPSIEAPSISPKGWKNPPSLTDLKADLTAALPDHNSAVGTIDKYLDNMHIRGSAKIKAKVGRSAIQPKLIRKQAEWRYPALSEPFLSTTQLFNASPVTAGDKLAAQQNELVLNSQFNNHIDKQAFIDEYVRALVDEGTVFVRVGWNTEEEEVTVKEPLYDLVPDENMLEVYGQMAQEQAMNPVLFEESYPTYIKNAFLQSMQDEVPYRPVSTGNSEIINKVKVVKNHPTVEVVPYNDLIIDPTCEGVLENAEFVIYKFSTSYSALKKSGRYKNLEHVKITPHQPTADGSFSEEKEHTSFYFKDKPRQKIIAYEYWGNWDIDGKGITTPFVATWVGDTLIELDVNPYPDQKHPFINVQYMPKRKEIYGEPDGALIIDNQKVNGAITRGMMDLMGRSANAQIGIRKDLLDTTNYRKFERGDDYQFNPTADPRQGIIEHKYPEIPNSAQFMLQLQNFEAESMSGVKAFSSQGLSGNALGDTATGIRGALDAASKRELGILRRLSAGIVKIGRKFISMNAVFLEEEEVIRITEFEFVPIKREDLQGKVDITLTISTAEEDEKKAQEIAFQLQTMGQSLPFELTQILLADQARLRKMPFLAKKIEEYRPEPDPIQQELAMLEVEIKKAELAKLHSEATRNNADAGKKQSEKDKTDLDYIEQESGVKQARDKEKIATQAESQTMKSIIEASLKAKEAK